MNIICDYKLIITDLIIILKQIYILILFIAEFVFITLKVCENAYE